MRRRGLAWVAGDRGSGTVYGLAIAGLIMTLTFAAAALGEALIARHQAMAGADLAALAAADAVARGDPDPCAAADRIAHRQHAELVRCHTDGLIVDVDVAVRVGGLLGPGLQA